MDTEKSKKSSTPANFGPVLLSHFIWDQIST